MWGVEGGEERHVLVAQLFRVFDKQVGEAVVKAAAHRGGRPVSRQPSTRYPLRPIFHRGFTRETHFQRTVPRLT